MAPTKRKPSVSESTNPKRPKPSPSSQSSERSKGFSSLVSSGKETAFPRGGGTSLSAAEVKNAKAEGQREAEAALGKDAASSSQSKAFKHGPSKNKKPRTSQVSFLWLTSQRIKFQTHSPLNQQNKAEEKKSGTGAATTGDSESSPSLRIDHLNYKRLSPGQRVLCSVVQVRPLELIVSLPNQLLGHIPITSVSSHFTHRLAQDAQQSDSESEEDDPDENDLPELSDWFTPGQLLTAVVNTIKSADINKKSIMGDAASRKDRIDEEFRWSRRLELSLDPAKVNEGIKKEDLVPSLVNKFRSHQSLRN